MQRMEEQLASGANAAVRKYKEGVSKPGAKVIMPGGHAQDAGKYLATAYKFRDATHVFNDPERYLIHPKPGHHYAWAEFHIGGGRPREGAMRTEAMVRKEYYRPVEPSEIRKDADLPYSTGTTKKRVEIYDVMLVEITPEAWERLYELREALSVMALTRHFETAYNTMSSEGAEFDVDASVGKDGFLKN